MNIKTLLNKTELFQTLVIDSGFKRDLIDNLQAIQQPQNRNLVFLKSISESLLEKINFFEDNSLPNELKILLKKTEPFINDENRSKLQELLDNNLVDANTYYSELNSILQIFKNQLESNQQEIDEKKDIFSQYFSDEFEKDVNEALLSLIFKDEISIGTIKEFSKVLKKWDRTLTVYYTLLKSDSPEDIELVDIQEGSIDVAFNLNVDVALDLVEVFKVGFKVFSAYLLYKSKVGATLIETYFGNKKLIDSEKEREGLLLDNILEAIKNKITEQHKSALKNDKNIDKTGYTKKVDEVSKVITEHIIKGNDIKLITYNQDEGETNVDEVKESLRVESAKVNENRRKLDQNELQKLIDYYKVDDVEL